MLKKVAFRQNLKFYSASLLGLLILLTFFSYFFKQDFNPYKITQDVQKIVFEKDNEILGEIETLKLSYQKSPDSIFETLDQYKNIFDSKGYVFLIFKDGSPVFWSDNNVPLSFFKTNLISSVINDGNGWYRTLVTNDDSLSFIGLYLIKQNYSYQNEYLENSFHKSFGLSKTVGFSENENSQYNIKSSGNEFLFSLSFDSYSSLNSGEINFLLVLFLLIFITFIGIIYEFYLYMYRKTGKYFLFIFGFIVDLILIRIGFFYFHIPQIFFRSKLFTPYFYAYSDLIPSIGDLFVNALFLLIFSLFIFYHVKFDLKYYKKNPLRKYFIVFTLFLHIFIFFRGIEFVFESLIIDSNISLDLNNIFSLSEMSFFNFFIISAFIVAYLLIATKLTFFAFKYCKNILSYTIILFIVFVLYSLFCLFFSKCDIWYLIFVFFFILSFAFFYIRKIQQFNLGTIVFYITLFSIISTYSLHKYNTIKENEYRKLLAVNLASEQRDPLAEYLFQKESDKIFGDQKILEFLNDYGQENFMNDKFYAYFFQNFFTGYWKKYELLITICNSNDVLMVQPDNIPINCDLFFENKISQGGEKTESPELYFLNYSAGDNGYLAVLDFSNSNIAPQSLKLFVELFPKYVARDLGFPDLLVDEEISKNPDLSEYSYAKYQNGELYKRVGEYFYNINIQHYPHTSNQFGFFTQNNYDHLYYKVDDNKELIISKKQKSFLSILAPFSYLFLFFILFSGLIFFMFIFPFSKRKIGLSFRTRLQISMSLAILFSFLVIGIFTIIYINNLNDKKNSDILSEKTHSVLVEMQHKYSEVPYFDEDMSATISDLLVKFSNVFFTDINLFDLDGKIIASSRPQIFDEKLISQNINPSAYKVLSIDKSSLYIHEENIGKQEYLSAYIPFVNSMGNVIAYLNLPYFAKENELNREISTFLVAYINIYVILIALSVLIALVISNYISRPIKMIVAKIRQVKLVGHNETIAWSRKDEIGQLVTEYNRMIDELARSAELLARSERESAWLEMAKQVAHEIKNPLTPMKLSVQYLQRAWKNQSPDWEIRLDKFTQTMIEQIEALANIATEFSDFAKMPISKKETIDLVDVIQSSISLFKNYDNLQITLNYNANEIFIAYTDREQLLRAFNNLLKNSIQAIDIKEDGRIDIDLTKKIHQIFIKIADNGGGIPGELSQKIFSPNFTTKSGGMGLGLAIVKNVINNSGGEISYSSTEGMGTIFTITLPIAYEKNIT